LEEGDNAENKTVYEGRKGSKGRVYRLLIGYCVHRFGGGGGG